VSFEKCCILCIHIHWPGSCGWSLCACCRGRLTSWSSRGGSFAVVSLLLLRREACPLQKGVCQLACCTWRSWLLLSSECNGWRKTVLGSCWRSSWLAKSCTEGGLLTSVELVRLFSTACFRLEACWTEYRGRCRRRRGLCPDVWVVVWVAPCILPVPRVDLRHDRVKKTPCSPSRWGLVDASLVA